MGKARAVRIATGAVVPAGTTAILRREDGGEGAATLLAERPPREGDIRRRGEECSRGEALAPAGAVVTPALAGLAAAAGHDVLRVAARPSAALLVFGDEIAESGIPALGQVRDSLGPQLPAWMRGMGASVTSTVRGEDTLDAHVRAIADAAASADLVLTTGGTAAGPVDHLHSALRVLGARLIADGVAVRPGFPMVLAEVPAGTARRVPLVALPGNPQSAVIAATTLAWPLVVGMLGQGLPPLGRTWLGSDLEPRPADHRLVAGRRDDSGVFAPSGHVVSSMLRGLARSEGFAVLPPGRALAGEEVPWQPLPPFAPDGGAP